MAKPKSDLGAYAWWQVSGEDVYGGCLNCGKQFFLKSLIDHLFKCWKIPHA